MKTCFKCKEEKPFTDFYVHKEMGDGYLGKCKICTKKDVRENEILKYDKYREYKRLYMHRDNVSKKVKEYNSRPDRIKANSLTKKNWATRNRRKSAAHIIFGNWMRYNKDKKTPCIKCGNNRSQGHHENYDYPLSVVWLCSKHHAERHIEMRKFGIQP